MLVIGLITASGFWVWWFTQYRPRLEEIEILVQQENRLRVANQQARRTVAALGIDRIREAIDAYDRQAEHVAQLVPADTVVFDALALISNKAQPLEVRVIGVQPSPEETSGAFRVQPYQVRVSGTYHDVAAFMAELLSLPRITRITDARLRQLEQSTGIPNEVPVYAVEASFTLKVYATRLERDGAVDPGPQSGTSSRGTGS